MKILLVEDDEALLKIMEHRFSLSGTYQIYTASNGKEAMQLAQQYQPDVVITDMLMPLFSGAELINFIRTELQIPAYVIAMSAIGVEDFTKEAIEIGADRFVAKPFDLSEFVSSVESFFSVARAS